MIPHRIDRKQEEKENEENGDDSRNKAMIFKGIGKKNKEERERK